MKNTIVTLFLVFIAGSLLSQPVVNMDHPKLMGQRYVNKVRIKGSPFLFDDWINGRISLTSGERVDSVPLKFDAYRNELMSYDKGTFTILTVEKAAVHSFEFDFKGEHYLFEQRFFDGLLKGNRYFRVLFHGDADLLCFYKVDILNTSIYTDENGITKNQEYVPGKRYFLYTPRSGYSPGNLKRNSFLRFISKTDRKVVRSLLRQHHLVLGSEAEFIRALDILQQNKIKLHF